MERLATLHPDGVAELERINAVARSTSDRALLELCHARAEALLTLAAWDEPADVCERERAFLDFTEQFVTSVSHVSDEDVERLLDHASPTEVYGFINSLYVLEMTTRVKLVAKEVLA